MDSADFNLRIQVSRKKKVTLPGYKQTINLVYKQLFNKKNRQMITTLRFGITDDDQEGKNRTELDFYKNGIQDSSDVVDQLKTFKGNSKTFGGKITFSEPLNEKLNLVLEYAHNRNNSQSYNNSYNKTTMVNMMNWTPFSVTILT